MLDLKNVLLGGCMGGLLGGCAVGVCEAVYLLASSHEVTDYQPLVYAAVLYGLVGMGVGLGASFTVQVVMALARRPFGAPRLWSVGCLTPVCTLGLAITVWLLRRELYDQILPPRLVLLAALVGFVLLGAAIFVTGAGVLKRTMLRALLRPAGGFGTYAGVVLFLFTMHIGSGQLAPVDVPARPVPEALAQRPNVLLLTVDSLRADHLGCYGGIGGVSPRIDALAAEAVVYEQAVAHASWTRPSVASLLTSVVPSTHRTQRRPDRLPGSFQTLPELLSDAGYTTGARVNDFNLSGRFSLQQGFADFEYMVPDHPFWAAETSYFLVLYAVLRDEIGERLIGDRRLASTYYRDAGSVTAEGMEFIQEHRDGRWALMLHYKDPHEPYFRRPYDGHAVARAEHEVPPDGDAVRALYADEVGYLDEHVGVLLDFLRDQGLYDDTAIVLVADHGQELDDHGGWWQGTSLYDEQIRVPLIVKYPEGFRYVAGTAPMPADEPAAEVEVASVASDQVAPAPPLIEGGNGDRVVRQVRLIDVAPTVAALAGRSPAEGWQGVTLAGPWEQRAEADKVALSELHFEGNDLTSLRAPPWKLIVADPDGHREHPECSLFDLRADPHEQVNLGEDGSLEAERERLVALMDSLLSSASP